tara:strand:+ start:3485 stop:7765 length:4281 start_codon:yes stop_codon:yes gene_type:complete
MVEYTLVLELGQSNASPVGDIQGWEDKHPELAIRSPNTARSEAKQFSTGSYRDDFTLAATFKGGPQVGDVGTEMGAAINGQWQTVNLRGVAVDAVRVATFYNPIGTLQTSFGHARSWPGTYNVVPATNALAPNTAREFSTNFIVQQGRQSTQCVSAAGSTLTTAAHVFKVNDIVVFGSFFTNLGLPSSGPFRVTAITGTTFAIETWPEGATVNATSTGSPLYAWKVNDLDAPSLITRKRTGSTHTYAPTGLGVASWSQASGGARLVVDPPFNPAQSDEEEFTVPMSLQQDAGSTSNPLVFDAFLGGFVNNNPAVTISTKELTTATSGYRWFVPSGSPLRGGRAVSGAAATPATVVGVDMEYTGANSTWGAASSSSDGVATFATEPPIQNAESVRLTTTGGLPGSLSTATTYYARNVRKDVSNDDFLAATSAGYIALGSDPADQVYMINEPVRLVAGSGGLPTGLDENTTYYAQPVAPGGSGISEYGIALQAESGSGVFIVFDGSASGGGTHTIRRPNSFNLSTASTGALLDFSSTGGSGTHSVIRSTVTTSANHNLVTGSPLKASADPAKVPGGLTASAAYFAIRVSDTEFKVAASLVAANAGTAIELTAAPSSGTGEWTVPYVTGALWPTRQLAPVVPPALTSGQTLNNYVVVSTPQEFAVGEQVRVSYGPTQGVPPTNLPAGDYYVVEVDTSVTGSERLRLATDKGGTALAIVWFTTVGDSPSIERINAYVGWLVSPERGGADWKNIAVPTVGVVTLAEVERFAGSVSGLRLRCASGANQGQWKHGTHVTHASTAGLAKVHYDGAWAVPPERNSIFVLEPTPVGVLERPFRKFCQLLPWAPFEGLARGGREAGPAPVGVSWDVATAQGNIAVTGMFAPDRTSVRFYTTGTLPNGLTPGKTYYSALAAGDAFNIAATYGGAALQRTGEEGSGSHYAETVDNDNGFNPHPPGFNYPGQFAMPRRYMPFDGYVAGSFYGEETAQQASGVTAGVQLSFDLYNYTGRRTLFVPLAFGNTSIAHREVHQPGDGRSPFGWHDPDQQISWAPGEDNGCFARLEDTLDGVKLALTEEGSTVKDVVVHFNQGEADATEEYTSTTYRQNLNRLKQAVRQALYDRGLSPVKAERIKWLHATINESTKVWAYAKTVNVAIEAEAQADPYSRALVGTDLEVHAERDTFAGNPTADGLHYHGAEMDKLGKRAFVAYKALERSGYNETEVCNMALSYLGEPGRMVNVDTDTSREAELCRQFLPLARDELLERHPWDFALRSVKPTKRSASPRVDYRYAYDYPEGIASVLGLVRSDVSYNYKTMGTTGQHEYTVELDDNGDRMVLTDLDEALMLYVAKVTDPTKWSTTFTSALAWRLVFHLAGAILKGEEGSKKALAATEMAERALRTATKHDSDNKRDVDISNHVPTFLRHRSNPGSYRR